MSKICIPGFFCFSNIFSLFLTIIIVYFLYNSINNTKVTTYIANNTVPPGQSDILLNPYSAPYYNTNFFAPTASPISYAGTNFRQVGILTPLHASASSTNNIEILPLMGRPLLQTRRSNYLWNYYTITNQHNNIKVPIICNGKDGLCDTGVNELTTGDSIIIDGYDKPYKVKIYQNNTILYLPY